MPGDAALTWRVASTPSMPGMARSIRTTSGASSPASRTAACTVTGLADHLDAGSRLEEPPKPVAYHRMIVDQQDPQGPGHGRAARRQAWRTRSCRLSRFPGRSVRRSPPPVDASSPAPARGPWPTAMPWPSSVTVSSSRPLVVASVTVTRLARRRAAPRCGRLPRPRDSRRPPPPVATPATMPRPPQGEARRWTARRAGRGSPPTRPTSSKAGGRSPSMMRRRSDDRGRHHHPDSC